MKKIIVFVFCILGLNGVVDAQKYFTREGKISFHSDAPIEKIEAINNKATSVIDTETGKMEFAVLIKAFNFEKALMQEHFNENYMESDQFPKSKFKGKIINIKEVDFGKEGTYEVSVVGDLTLHGVTHPIETKGSISIVGDQISASAKFEIAVADYGIKIPAAVRDNIAKVVIIDVDIENYQLFKRKSSSSNNKD